MQILDAYGQPIKRNLLDKPLAAPALSGVRSIWNYSYVTGGLTPASLSNLLQASANGDADAYLTLAEEMEEKDPHYGSVLGTRKRAVARLPIVVEAADDSPQALDDAEEIRKLFKRPGTKAMLEACLDSLGKGYSVVEILWDRSRTPWQPSYIWRDPRFFQYDRETLSQLRLKDEADVVNGIPLAPCKFIVHIPRLKMGLPIRGGLARLAAWSFIFKNYSVKDWMAFCEVFGMPLRVGKYRPNETEDNIAILKSAVANLGSDAAAVIPEGMMIEFVDGARSSKSGGSESLFQQFADWLDRQVSKGILGQTMTTDDGSSQSQALVHNEVRHDLRDADAEQLAETLLRDLVVPYINLNFGVRENYPQLFFREPEGTDITIMSEALAKLVPLGLKVEVSEVRDRLGFSDPAKEAECLEAFPYTPTTPAFGHPSTGGELKSPYVEGAMNTLTPAPASPLQLLNSAEALLNEVDDLKEFEDQLIDLYAGSDPTGLAIKLAQMGMLANMAGRVDALAPTTPAFGHPSKGGELKGPHPPPSPRGRGRL